MGGLGVFNTEGGGTGAGGEGGESAHPEGPPAVYQKNQLAFSPCLHYDVIKLRKSCPETHCQPT